MKAKQNLINLLLFLFIVLVSNNHLMAKNIGHFSELPVKPQKERQKTRSKFKIKRINIKEKSSKYKLPSERTWGIWSLGIGGFFIIFSILSAMFFLGFPFYLYLLAILAVLLSIGVFMSISGVALIDQSYIDYSDNLDLLWERLKPQIFREFLFSGILVLVILGLFILNYYITAYLCILALFLLLTLAIMKLYNFKRLKRK